MAMPVAMGIEGMTSKNDKATIASGSPRGEYCPNTVIQTSVRAAAETNHLICWRSSPLDRRKRTNSELTAPPPGQQHQRKRNEHDQHLHYMGRALIAGHQRWAPLGPEQYHRRHGSQADGEAAEPSHRAPALRRRVTVGEQQGQEHQDQAEPGGPDPLPEPGRFPSQWDSAGIREQRVDCVLVSGAQEPIAEALG